MGRNYDYKKFAVLTVDDEEQALKYFDKVFSKDFRVITASNARRAMEILEHGGDEIGVLVTDHRMPGQTGVDLLDQVRQIRPDIVRIITTAYSDLESAIEAVNRGGVFRYISKPWNIREVRGVLLRAMEFFLVQRERDTLLREKLSVLQRMIVLDRVRGFTVLAASLAFRVRHSMAALKAFFDFVPVTVSEQAIDTSVNWGELWGLAQHESQRIVQAVDEVLHATVESEYTFDNTVLIDGLVKSQAEKIGPVFKEKGVDLVLDLPPDLPPLKADAGMVGRLVGVLLSRVGALAQEGQCVKVRVRGEDSVCGAAGIRLSVTSNSAAWHRDQVASIFASIRPRGSASDRPGEMGADILSAFFIAHHHGGALLVHPAGAAGPGFELLIPFDPEATQRPPLESDWLDRIFTNLEGW